MRAGDQQVVSKKAQHTHDRGDTCFKQYKVMGLKCLVTRLVLVVQVDFGRRGYRVVQPAFQPPDLARVEPEAGIAPDEQRPVQ